MNININEVKFDGKKKFNRKYFQLNFKYILLIILLLFVFLLLATPTEITASDLSIVATQATPQIESQTQPRPTDLPIDINAIGRGEQPEIILSLRFFDLDLFSANSQVLNNAMVERHLLNQEIITGDLFSSFEAFRTIDVDELTAYAAGNLNLFSNPANFGRIGQTEQGSEIPIWIIAAILLICAALGLVVANIFVRKNASG